MKFMRIATVAGAAGAVAALAAAWSTGANADRPPFAPTPMAGNIGALHGPPAFSPPAAVVRLEADLYPAGTQVHALGRAGHAWSRADGSVCVLMANGAGGCGTTFNEPVMLFLTGERETRQGRWLGPVQVTGLVPDAVTKVVLVTTSGERVNAPITRNGLAVQLPAGTAIAGEQVTFAGGSSFFNEDPLGLPN